MPKSDTYHRNYCECTEIQGVHYSAEHDNYYCDNCHSGMGTQYYLAARRRDELETLINTPELHDFAKAVSLEAAHQIERWGEEHDMNKTPDDWFWTVAYLATKATQAKRYGDNEKYLHHIITAAALLNNWHRQALKEVQENES